MSKFRCFDTYNLNNYSSSDYIKNKRRNTIFTEAQTIAIGNASFQNGLTTNSIPPGYLTKQDGSQYYGPVYVSTKSSDLNNCLVSARSYELLYDVLLGATPSPADIDGTTPNLTNASWEGNVSKISFLPLNNVGPALSAIPDFSYDMIDYAARQDFFPQYDDPLGNPSTRYPGIVIDPCYNVFYNSCTSTSKPNNYMKNITYNFNEQKFTNPDLVKYLSKTTSKHFERFPYSLNFQTTTCEKYQFTLVYSFTNTNNDSIEYILANCLPISNKDNTIILSKPIVKRGNDNLITIIIEFKYTGGQSSTDGFTFCPYDIINGNIITRDLYANTPFASTSEYTYTKSLNNNTSVIEFYNNTNAPVTIEQFNNMPLAPDGRQFYGLNHLVINAKDSPTIKPNTSLEESFKNVETFINTNNGLNNWNTKNVVNMKSTFENSGFNNDLNKWDTSNVTNMSYMFANATNFNGDITNWNTSNVKNMSHMFANASSFDKMIKYDSNGNKWNVSNVEDITNIFLNATLFNNKYNTHSNSDNKISLGWNLNKI
jgi:surface protein